MWIWNQTSQEQPLPFSSKTLGHPKLILIILIILIKFNLSLDWTTVRTLTYLCLILFCALIAFLSKLSWFNAMLLFLLWSTGAFPGKTLDKTLHCAETTLKSPRRCKHNKLSTQTPCSIHFVCLKPLFPNSLAFQRKGHGATWCMGLWGLHVLWLLVILPYTDELGGTPSEQHNFSPPSSQYSICKAGHTKGECGNVHPPACLESVWPPYKSRSILIAWARLRMLYHCLIFPQREEDYGSWTLRETRTNRWKNVWLRVWMQKASWGYSHK